MNQIYMRMKRMREKYVDTLAKLYEYATTVYAKKQYTQWYDTKEGGYTYSDFKKKCDNLSKKLTQYGIGDGDKVAILSQSMPNWSVAFFSIVPFGRIAIPILPKGTMLKKATDQLGMLCERMAALSPTPIPYWVSFFESPSHLLLNEAKVYPPSFESDH